ncbi:MAG: thioredoxin domain-containing protein [Pseudomonadota bacterium]
MSMKSILRRTALAAGLAIVLAACGGPSEPEANADNGATANAALTDLGLGPEDAKVVLVEYASITCPTCQYYHNQVILPIVKPYAERGDIRYVFREFPTPPENISIAGSVVARCAGDDKFFDVVDDLFRTQQGIMAAARQGSWGDALEVLAARHGLDSDAYRACLKNPDLRIAVDNARRKGFDQGVKGTPTFFLNDVLLENVSSPDAMQAALDAAIAEANGGATEPEPPTEE